jgi:hypothetical protein
MAEGWTLLPLIHISENHIANHLDGQICPVFDSWVVRDAGFGVGWPKSDSGDSWMAKKGLHSKNNGTKDFDFTSYIKGLSL